MSTTTEQPKRAIRAMRMLIDEGARRYDAGRHLERLLAAESALSGKPDADRAAVIARIKRALRSQRQLGRAGHWSYDLNRHFGLLQALKAEQARARAEATNIGEASTGSGGQSGRGTDGCSHGRHRHRRVVAQNHPGLRDVGR